MTMRMAIAGLAALALASCTGLPEITNNGDVRDDIRALTAFAITDLTAAKALAEDANDQIAAMCWTDLLRSAERLQSVANQQAIGVATKWQLARNVRRNNYDACDAIVSDARSTLFSIASRLGVVIPGL